MALKETARLSFIKELEGEDLDFDVKLLNDVELKSLYLKHQKLKQGQFRLQVPKGEDFYDCLVNEKLQFVSFRNTPDVRRLTLKEYLSFEKYVAENPNAYVINLPLGIKGDYLL